MREMLPASSAVGCELQTRMNIICGKFREIINYFAFTHSACQVFQHIINGNAQGTGVAIFPGRA